MRTEKPSFRFRSKALRRRLRSDAGDVSSWLILAAGLTAAAVLASAVIQTTVSSLADEVAVAAGVGSSSQPAGAPGAPGNPAAPGDLGTTQAGSDQGALPTLESEGLTLTSRQRVINGDEFLILEVADEDGNVEALGPPIQLGGDDSDTNVADSGDVDLQAATTREPDALDEYTIDDYVADQAALGNQMHPISITAAEADLDLIQETFADSDPATRERVLADIRNLGVAPVAHIAGASADALPQDHYEDNLLGLIADTLFGWMRSRGRTTPPPALPIDRGIERPSDESDYNPTPGDSDGDGIPDTLDTDFNPTPTDTDGDGIPDVIDRDGEPADPFDLGIPVADPPPPSNPPPTNMNNNTDGETDRQQEERGTTSNPGNPDNPAGEPDECHGSCA